MKAGIPYEATRLDEIVPARRGRLFARDKRAILYALSLMLDCGSLVGGYFVALTIRRREWLDAGDFSILTAALPIFLMLMIAREVQSVEALGSRTIAIRRALRALIETALALVVISFAFKIADISRLGFVIMFGAAAVMIIFGKLFVGEIMRFWMDGAPTSKLLLVDGTDARPEPGVAAIDVRALGLTPSLAKPQSLDTLSRLVMPYDRVIVACGAQDRERWATFLKGHDAGGEILLDRDLLHGAVAIGQYGARDTLVLSLGPLSQANQMKKRVFDIVSSLVGLLFLAPMMILVAIMIKLESPGPVFFRQVRIGQGNRHFRIYKFRSMRTDLADHDGRTSALRDDPRVTRVGRLIRKTSIDELPQLINVLFGDMSIVGPRPHALGSLAGENLFWEVTDQYWVRHALKPGITGLAQIRGFRGSTETVDDLQNRVRADLEYLTNWSLLEDCLIVLRTLRVMVHTNAY